ncbi:DUF485 domain-containing protein [Stigmatella sp. ncwal1]|uniref:DUF485 domain-containing protein n=1 Tax=Stigmatella ashevillensis TaxID=2995309 RepID=A0ABT5D6Z9_9BACT|nr:DUF485 domain-containing protein [Stigmatella ashevillena]MDC0709440.1 DUF485 domain-containing protein [Stigmatella ashevillena]
MIPAKAQEIARSPKYQELVKKRSTLGWSLTIVMLIVYYGYICLVAFNKEFLARPMGEGVTTLSIPIGLGVIVFTILITGVYVRRANSEFDRLNEEIVKEAK